MVIPWGALAGAGLSGALGAIGSHKANTARRTARGRGRRILDRLQGITNRSYAGQEDLLRSGISDLLRGFDVARSEAGRLAGASRRQALDTETRMAGQLGSQLQASGLGNTSIGANLQRGLAADTSRRLQDIDAGLAGLYGDIAQQRGQAAYGGQQALQGLMGQKLGSDTAIQNERYGLFTGGEMAAPPPGGFDMGGIADLLSQLFGGGGAGGAAAAGLPAGESAGEAAGAMMVPGYGAGVGQRRNYY